MSSCYNSVSTGQEIFFDHASGASGGRLYARVAGVNGLKRGKGNGASGSRGGGNSNGPLQVGRKVRDNSTNRTGTILDFACQYAHPKADPAYNYLIRWEDGQIQAFSAQALEGRYGLELLD